MLSYTHSTAQELNHTLAFAVKSNELQGEIVITWIQNPSPFVRYIQGNHKILTNYTQGK